MTQSKRIPMVAAASALCAACGVFDGASSYEYPNGPGLCFTLGAAGEERCLDPETLELTRTEASGHDWFRVRGTMPVTWETEYDAEVTEDREVTVFGQVSQATETPTGAEHVFVSIPVVGECTANRLTNIFGRCDVLTLQTVCDASIYADPARASLIVDRLEDGAAAGRFDAALSASVPAACCQSSPGCPDDIQPTFAMEPELPVVGWFNLGGE